MYNVFEKVAGKANTKKPPHRLRAMFSSPEEAKAYAKRMQRNGLKTLIVEVADPKTPKETA